MVKRTAKKQRIRQAKQQLCTCITLFCTFLCRRCTTSTYVKVPNFTFFRGRENEQPVSWPFLFSWTSIQSFRIQLQKYSFWTRWNKRDKVWSSANSLFRWRIRVRRGRCWLSSLLINDCGGWKVIPYFPSHHPPLALLACLQLSLFSLVLCSPLSLGKASKGGSLSVTCSTCSCLRLSFYLQFLHRWADPADCPSVSIPRFFNFHFCSKS